MSRDLQSAVLLVFGVLIGRIALTGTYTAYVKLGLRIPLLLSAALLIGVAIATVMGYRDEPAEAHVGDGGGHGEPHLDAHGHAADAAPRVGLLMLAPVLAIVLIAPAPLGAFFAERGGANRIEAPTAPQWPPLPEAVDGAVPLTLSVTISRALYDPQEHVRDVPVRLVGFIAESDAAPTPGFALTRFTVGCCAADGQALQVFIDGSRGASARDEWVEVVAVWRGEIHEEGLSRIPILELVSLTPIGEPDPPYEY